MRITKTARDIILKSVFNIDSNAKIWLFGSRVDDAKKGGDIDIAILSQKIDLQSKIRIRRAISDVIGEQKIDIVVSKDGIEPFFRLAQKTGRRLDEKN